MSYNKSQQYICYPQGANARYQTFQLFKTKTKLELTYNIVLVLGVQHNDLIYVYITK